MKIILASRRMGKTTLLIREAAAQGYYIVCHSREECSRIFGMAKELELDINFPITYDEFLKSNYSLRGVKGIVIDNVDLLIRRLSKVIVHTITMTPD